MYCQYTTHIEQDAIIKKLGDVWLHVSAVTGHLQATEEQLRYSKPST